MHFVSLLPFVFLVLGLPYEAQDWVAGSADNIGLGSLMIWVLFCATGSFGEAVFVLIGCAAGWALCDLCGIFRFFGGPSWPFEVLQVCSIAAAVLVLLSVQWIS